MKATTYKPGPTKAVAYSYPSSPSAEQFHMGLHGCYTVYLRDDDYDSKPPRAVRGFLTFTEAEAYARQSDLPWSVWSK